MSYVDNVISEVKSKYSYEPEFVQAVEEVFSTLKPLLDKEGKYEENDILRRLVEPERAIHFKVTWVDDKGKIQVNRCMRIQFNSAIGPYKGGLRFHPSVYSGIIKFLGFEQVFKNSLTTLAIGGGKGGSDFDPKGKSDREVMRFCQAFMSELQRHIGSTTDVPAGDIGVGGREIGYLYGEYKKLKNEHTGVLTGKGLNWGGSLARKEATGYGNIYFASNMLEKRGDTLKGKICAVSGSGNVATYAMEKLYQLGATPVTASDSRGAIYHAKGIDLDLIKELKEVKRVSLEEYIKTHKDAEYTPTSKYPTGHASVVWTKKVDCAFPCATQNELNEKDAQTLLDNGCICVSEGANMPSNNAAIGIFLKSKIAFGPAKAANAGGVATSQLEMEQNAGMTNWTFDEVDAKLKGIMKSIFDNAYDTSKEFGVEGNLVLGANIAGFRKVADSMIDQGIL